jgi:folylpolyglutamate synthase/dihydropteroate synthase
MRTTLTLDEDVADKTRALAARMHKPFKTVVNQALRLGLEQVEKPARQRRYRTKPHALRLRKGHNLDNIQELLAQVEGEDFR